MHAFDSQGDAGGMDSQLAHELQELIEALDRRVPRLERANESSIAREAAALKEKALKRLAELRERDARQGSELRPG